jgi:hypothetical protein
LFRSVGASTARTYIGIYTKFAPKDKIMDPGRKLMSKTSPDVIRRLILPVGVTATCVWTLIEIQVGILAASAPTIRPVLRELVQSGIFGSLVSSVRSIVSGSRSRSNISGSDHAQTQYGVKGSVDKDEVIQLHDMSGLTSASAEHVNDDNMPNNSAINVSKGFTVDSRHD